MALFTVYLGSKPCGYVEAATPREALREIMLDHGLYEEAIELQTYVEISTHVAKPHDREWWCIYEGHIVETEGCQPIAIFRAPPDDAAE